MVYKGRLSYNYYITYIIAYTLALTSHRRPAGVAEGGERRRHRRRPQGTEGQRREPAEARSERVMWGEGRHFVSLTYPRRVTRSLPFTPPSRRLWAPFGSVPPPPVAFRLLPYGVNGKGVNDMSTAPGSLVIYPLGSSQSHLAWFVRHLTHSASPSVRLRRRRVKGNVTRQGRRQPVERGGYTVNISFIPEIKRNTNKDK